MINHQILVSVIVPTFNSERFLEKCLQSVRKQTYPNIEIIVVDNHSTDKTRRIAEKYADLILFKGPERSAQVNFGVKHANGKYVYRVDSDFVVDQCVVEEAIKKCEAEGFAAVCVHNTSDSSVSFWSKVRKLERDCYKHDNLNIGARFMKKEVFDAVGGFDETIIAAEDYDMHNRILQKGFSLGRIKSQEIHIGEPKTLSAIVRKHFYYGRTIESFIKKNPRIYKKQLSPARLSYFKHRSQFVKNPKLTAGFVVYQFVRYFSTLVGFLTVKIEGNISANNHDNSS